MISELLRVAQCSFKYEFVNLKPSEIEIQQDHTTGGVCMSTEQIMVLYTIVVR